MTHDLICLDGETFDLSHLAPRLLLCPRIEGEGEDHQIAVAFSHHIYTSSELPPGTSDTGHRVVRGRESRHFNRVRWQQSIDHMTAMVDALPHARVEFAYENRNFRYALGTLILPDMQYALFFSLKRHGGPDADLTLFVESAYPIKGASRGKHPPHIRFQVLVAKVLRGEAVTRPPRR